MAATDRDSPDAEPVLRRRERVRTATVAEIKRLAWEQVARGGALGVSLRAIARDMGMTSSALYRYFDSHEQLLSELACDGFRSMADALEAAEAEIGSDGSTAVRWMHVAGAQRRWALEHATEYALMFGTPMEPHKEVTVGEHNRGVAVLFRVMLDGLARSDLDPSVLPPLTPGLEAQLGEWQEQLGLPISPTALAGCLFVWSQLHGAVSLELFGQLPPMVLPADELFDHHMRTLLRTLGCAES